MYSRPQKLDFSLFLSRWTDLFIRIIVSEIFAIILIPYRHEHAIRGAKVEMELTWSILEAMSALLRRPNLGGNREFHRVLKTTVV